ncbi:MAG: hypothetical protein QGG36_31505 [Pirellulaceae bacterium]|jgi:hypothetical protein|nr:hypothetical protein [Pirellulaceae bacterium]MDP7020367.1 hypothetical protein [Pirellulaceae bacterium]
MRITISTCVMLALMAVLPAMSWAQYNLPPAHMLLERGPGVGGPGPGVLAPSTVNLPTMIPGSQATAQIWLASPEGMQVRWDVSAVNRYDSSPLVVPGRHNFPQGGIFRLKLTNVPNREGVELYPTLEVAPSTPRTAAFLAHNSVPIQFTEEDFDQVLTGNFITKVIYLPDPEFQELALARVETLVSTKLDPGMNPIKEADRRGSIMAIVRLGNKDAELPGTQPGGVVPATWTPNPAAASPLGPSGLLPRYVAGITAPQYGMTSSATPIGLPGPPHLPHGIPAGLRKHVMKNHTPIHLPQSNPTFKIHVRQQPGISYPKPASRVSIREQMIRPPQYYSQPHWNMQQRVR